MSGALLVEVLRAPGRAASLRLPEWDLLLRQARAAELLASLGLLLREHGLEQEAPAPARRQLEWALAHWRRHVQAVHFELAAIRAALAEPGLPLLLLKGTAYLAAGLPAAAGRLFSDVDILVPKERIGEVEGALMLHGWTSTHHDPYDQRYYREWMHELPPLRHMHRQSVIDVHHAIVPETAALRPDPARLRAAARGLPGQPGLEVLAPADMVLHSATHLFSEGEFQHGLRDLFDLHRLLLHFGAEPGFWATLPERARELQLARPLFYALRYTGRLLGTPVPAEVLEAAAAGRPNPALLALMDALFARALAPPHASCARPFDGAARAALYVRGNWLRMPPLLLSRHLFHKAFISPKPAAAP